jgi:hypothetical protein
MGELIFSEFLKALNKGLIFKDSNVYTQFSKNQEMVLSFYDRYFSTETVDLVSDMKQIFYGFVKHASHPQMLLTTLKILSKPHQSQASTI